MISYLHRCIVIWIYFHLLVFFCFCFFGACVLFINAYVARNKSSGIKHLLKPSVSAKYSLKATYSVVSFRKLRTVTFLSQSVSVPVLYPFFVSHITSSPPKDSRQKNSLPHVVCTHRVFSKTCAWTCTMCVCDRN